MRISVFTTAAAIALHVGCGHRTVGVDGEQTGAIPSHLSTGLTIAGTACTAPPPEVLSPVRLLFLIDTSQSMNINDPAGERAAAVQDVIDAWGHVPDAAFVVLGFGDAVTVNGGVAGSERFVNDRRILQRALGALWQAGGGTDHLAALRRARQLVEQDLRRMAASDRARASYTMIMLTDGTTADAARAVAAVAEIVDVGRALGAGAVRFHSQLLSFNQPAWVVESARALCRDMAAAGRGTYREARVPEAIDMRSYEIERVPNPYHYGATTLLAANRNVVVVDGQPRADADGDGLADDLEQGEGLDPTRADSDGDGHGDLVEHRLGTPIDGACADTSDVDGDGLAACEEALLGSDPRRVDSDRDRVPDRFELMAGTDPAVRDHRGDQRDAPAALGQRAVLRPLGPKADGSRCYALSLERVALRVGENTIEVFLGEGWSDDPHDAGRYRLARLVLHDVKAAELTDRRHELQPDDFLLLR